MTLDEIKRLQDWLAELRRDAEKHDRGVDAAGRRLRGGLMGVIHACRDLRQNIQDERKARIRGRD
jgi:hypothetical protein